MIKKFSFTIFHWQGFGVRVDDQQVSVDKFWLLKINNILATFSLLSVYTRKFLTWQIFLVTEKLARQIFLDEENLSTIPHRHEQFFLVKANLSRKNCSCKWGLKKGLAAPVTNHHANFWVVEKWFFVSFVQGMGHHLESRTFTYVMGSLANNKMPTEFYEVSAMLAEYTSNTVMINKSASKRDFLLVCWQACNIHVL